MAASACGASPFPAPAAAGHQGGAGRQEQEDRATGGGHGTTTGAGLRCKEGCARRAGARLASAWCAERRSPRCSAPSSSSCSPPRPLRARGVLVMDDHGHVRAHRDAAAATTAEARPSAAVARALRAQPAARARAQTPRGSVLAVLGALGARGDVSPEERTTWAAGWRSASTTLKRLTGARRVQLGAVVANLTALAKAGRLTPSRAPQAVPDARAQPGLVVEGAAAELRPAGGLRRQRARVAVLPGPGHPGAVARDVRQGQRGLRSKDNDRPVAPARRGPRARRRSAPAGWPSSTPSRSTAAGPRGSAAWPRAPGSRRCRAPRRAWATPPTPTRRAARWASSARPPPEGVRVATRGRGPLPAVLLRAQAADRQRLRAVAQRPARPRGLGERRGRPDAVHGRRGRAAGGAARLRHRRVVAVLAPGAASPR